MQQELCSRLGCIPHGHGTKAYQHMLKGGELPLPLADRKGSRGLDVDVEELPIGGKNAPPLPIEDGDAVDDGPCDDDDLDRRLCRSHAALSVVFGGCEQLVMERSCLLLVHWYWLVLVGSDVFSRALVLVVTDQCCILVALSRSFMCGRIMCTVLYYHVLCHYRRVRS